MPQREQLQSSVKFCKFVRVVRNDVIGCRGAVNIRGGTEAFLAWSEKPLPKGATVLVIESRGARAVDVIEWEDVLGDSPRIPGLPLL